MNTFDVELNVTKDYIYNGTQCSGSECPIALTLRDKMEALFPDSGMMDVNVGFVEVSVSFDDRNYVAIPSQEMFTWMARFDNNEPQDVEPALFSLTMRLREE